jgi:hypothetical protein
MCLNKRGLPKQTLLHLHRHIDVLEQKGITKELNHSADAVKICARFFNRLNANLSVGVV